MTAALLGAADIRRLAADVDIVPTKKLGQNFVHDANTVRRIVQIAGVEPEDTVVEVGPGLGSLTLGVLETGAKVIAIEIDRRLAAKLPHTVAERLPDARLDVITSDALQVDTVEGEPRKIVANLPYNVSVPVLLHLLARVPSLESGVVMVQAEVGERIAADPGSRIYGVPSAKAAWYGEWRLAGTVPRNVFWPVPNVDSVLVSFQRRTDALGTPQERDEVFRVIDLAFAQRRKMLRSALSARFGGSEAASRALERVGVDPTTRGEQLDIGAFVRIAAETPDRFGE